METLSLTELSNEQIAAARNASSGRAAHTVHGGRDDALRQTLLALAAGRGLGDHESPGEATLFVLRGHIRLATSKATADATAGDYLAIPRARHSLVAVEDSAILLTVVAERR